MAKAMKETSWRTLMLLTTLFIVVVIVQGTVRSPRPSIASVQPVDRINLPQEPQEPQEPNEIPIPMAVRPPAVVRVVARAFGPWEDDEPQDANEPLAPNESGEAPSVVPE